MNMNEPPLLLRNEYINQGSAGPNNWLTLKLVGTKSNRSAIGARVLLRVGSRSQVQEVTSQSSYYSHNDSRLHFGMGQSQKADLIEIRWPNGLTEMLRDIPVDHIVTIREGAGVIR
jgi:hypothetical protein